MVTECRLLNSFRMHLNRQFVKLPSTMSSFVNVFSCKLLRSNFTRTLRASVSASATLTVWLQTKINVEQKKRKKKQRSEHYLHLFTHATFPFYFSLLLPHIMAFPRRLEKNDPFTLVIFILCLPS